MENTNKNNDNDDDDWLNDFDEEKEKEKEREEGAKQFQRLLPTKKQPRRIRAKTRRSERRRRRFCDAA